MIRWIRGFLSDRRSRVSWNGTWSSLKVFREGLPQGSVLAPLLWLIYVNDLAEEVAKASPSVGLSLFADDSALLSVARNLANCGLALQPALDAVARWCSKWKVSISKDKCCYTTFTLAPAEMNDKK
jgi:ribonuclease P/MRP protein subunit RPP40